MSVHGTAAYGMYPRSVALSEVVCALSHAGFEKKNICMVLSPAHPVATAMRDATIFNERDTNTSSERVIGWFSEFGAVVIPTVGFFIRSQAFFQALLAGEDFPTLSRGSRTLLGLGFSPNDATRLDHQLRDIGAMVYVSCRETTNANSAIDLLRRTGAREAASFEMEKAVGAAA